MIPSRSSEPKVCGSFEIFLSYSRKDNAPQKASDSKGWVTALYEEIIADHRRFSTEPLRIFFDTSDIRDMDDWRHRILEGLRHSRILLVCLSPNYFASEYCHWEFDEYVHRQVHNLMGQDSFAQVYFFEVPRAVEQTPDREKSWHELLCRSNYTDLRPWFPNGVEALRDEVVKEKLANLGTSLWERIQRTRRATGVPGNLRRHNPHFIGRNTELRLIHEHLALGAVGVVTALNGLGGLGKTELAAAYAHGWANCYPAGLWALTAEGKKEMLPLLGELCADLGLPLSIGPVESADQRGRRVLAELNRRTIEVASQDNDQGAACLILLDNVSEPALLAELQLAQLPREGWLRVVVTTREGPEKFPASRKKSLAFIAVDALTEEDAARLIEDHQLDGLWPDTSLADDRMAARAIARELGGFTLAVESVAIYLGLHPEIRPSDCLARLQAEGMPRVNDLMTETDTPDDEGDVASQMLWEGEKVGEILDAEGRMKAIRTKQLSLVLDATIAKLSKLERSVLDFAARLSPDCIPWPWLRDLVILEHAEILATRPGYPDPWLGLRRRLEGLRLLTSGDHPEIARMHRLVSACVRELGTLEARTDLNRIIVDFVGNSPTPFVHGLGIEVFIANWKLLSQSYSLNDRLIGQASQNMDLATPFAEGWTDLAYQLGDTELEEWWLSLWAGQAEKSGAFVKKKAAFLHRKGNTKDACLILQQHLQAGDGSFDVSSQLLMYFAQLGKHEEASELARRLEIDHEAILSGDSLRRAKFLHYKYFTLHEMDRNEEAVAANRLIRDVYAESHLTYDFLISTVNLGDALWATGKLDEASELLNHALSRGQSVGLAQVEDIAAICLANVLASSGLKHEAAKLYKLGESLSERIDHRWDFLYAQTYRALNDIEMGIGSPHAFRSIRDAAVESGFEYLAAITDSHVCIASFVCAFDEGQLKQCIDRGRLSPFPACGVYALSAMLRLQIGRGEVPEKSLIEEWVARIDQLSGIKGRIGVIVRLTDWLLEMGALQENEATRVMEWIARFSPKSLSGYFEIQYPNPNMSENIEQESTNAAAKAGSSCVRLRVCNLSECEARCCYDGVYLDDDEESKIRNVVNSEPEFFRQLPRDFIVNGTWEGRTTGRKTAVTTHEYQSPDFPAHFTRTRCVFCSEDHKCLLQVLAVSRGLHKWTYKPKACWMFPLSLVKGQPAPPPAINEPDPHCMGEHYPGYTKFVPCGQDREDGIPWDQTLSEEIAYYNETLEQ